MNKLKFNEKFNDFLKLKTKTKKLWTVHFFPYTKSFHFPLIGKFGQLSKRKRVLCWSIYIITFCLLSLDCDDKHVRWGQDKHQPQPRSDWTTQTHTQNPLHDNAVTAINIQ